MSPSSEGRVAFAPPLPEEARRAIRWVCTNNPFYAISAGLFLAGLWLSFGDPRQAENAWALMSGLVGYTLLLAGTVLSLVRIAKVWDDARTVLLLVVLMFLATSVTFDDVLVAGVVAHEPARGIPFILGGLAFAVGVSEILLRGIRLELPALFRVPYYLILSFFFLYPLALIPLLQLNQPRDEAIMWGLFGFAPIAGLLFLTLLPAVRRGAGYVRDNGSPWPWPLYPWSLFGLLALAVPGRAILLCYSMHLIGIRDLYESIFGFYFLVPFGLALAVILLEMGLVSRSAGAVAAALIVPAILVVLALPWDPSGPISETFLTTFTNRLGASPAYFALAGAACFYAYAAVRGVAASADLLTASLVLLAITGSKAMRIEGLVPFQQLPLLAAATVQLGMGVWRMESGRCLLGSLAGISSLVLYAEPATMTLRVEIAFHLTLLVFLTMGAIFDDDLSRLLRVMGTVLAFSACLLVLFVPIQPHAGMPEWVMTIYPLAMVIVLIGYGVVFRYAPALVGAGVAVGCWMGASGWQLYALCRQIVAGLDYLLSSLALFVVAFAISLGKAGLLSRWLIFVRRARAPESSE